LTDSFHLEKKRFDFGYFFTENVVHQVLQKMCWATFWAIFGGKWLIFDTKHLGTLWLSLL
jgi:hypothetical protein